MVVLNNDVAMLIINQLDYDDTRRWCQINQQFRYQGNLNYWVNKIRIDFDLTHGPTDDLMNCKPSDVTTAVYYKLLKVWLNKMPLVNFNLAAAQSRLRLPVLKLYYYKNNIRLNTSYVIQTAAKNGHLETVKWLYSLGDVDIQDKDLAFRWATVHGHLETAKWIYSLGGIDIHAGNDSLFKSTVGDEYLAVAQWLYSLGGVDIHVDNDTPFRLAVGRGHLENAQWLYSLGGIDIHALDDTFIVTADKCHLDAILWLYDLGGISVQGIRNAYNIEISANIAE